MVRFGLPALAPFAQEGLRLSVVQVGVLLTALDLGSFIAFTPVGLLADRWSERRVLIAGGLLMGLIAAASALAPTYPFLLVGLALAGIGFPSGHIAGSKLVMRTFPPTSRGVAIGIRQAGLPLGGMLAALLIPFLAGIGGWRWGLGGVGAACALFGLLCAALPREQADQASVAAPTSGRARIGALLADQGFVLATITATMLVIGQFMMQGYLALFLVDQHGWSPAAAGRLLVLVHLGGVMGRLVWGTASDRVTGGRRRPVLAWVVGGGAIVLLTLSGLPDRIGAGPAAPIAFFAGFFLAGWNGLAIMLIAELAGTGRAATAIGVSLTVMLLATMVGYPIFGWLVQASGSYALPWLLTAVCQTAALILLMRVQER
jgi:predicted MFS family arabinose efflux permease